MFKLDLSSKRAQLAVRFFTYGVMTLATVVITAICVFIAMGYRFDRHKLTFEQGGLVQFKSVPEGATVKISGQRQTVKTPNKANLAAGKYTVQMDLKDYRSWSKTIDLSAGQLLWLNYIRLIPNSIATTPLKTYDNLAAAESSPDRNWMLLQSAANQPVFELVDLRDPKKPVFTALNFQPTLFSKVNDAYGTFQVVEWDLKSQFVLMRHTLPDGKLEFVRVDRSKPAEAVNITQTFKLNIGDAHFAGNNANNIYAKTDDVLRKLDLGNNSASGALVSGVRQFIVYGEETLVYTADQEETTGQPATKRQIVGIFKRDKESVVKVAPLNETFIFDYADYFDHEYIAIGMAGSSLVTIIRDPQEEGSKENRTFSTLDLGKPVKWLSFSNNGRMLTAQNNNDIATYDLEEAKSYTHHFDIGTEITAPMRWLDDFYLWTDAGNMIRMVEFDGQNQREIASVKSGFGLTLGHNSEHLFSISGDSANKFVLQSSGLILKN